MRRLPPLSALRAFEAAARHLHFARAADELGLTPTAISHQVRLLEDRLGHQLFIRQPRPMRLTPEGAALAKPVGEAFDRIADAAAKLEGAAVAEPLKISMPHSFAARWFLPRLLEMPEDLPAVQVEASDDMVELAARTVDAAIRYPSEPPKGSVVAHPLFDDQMVPISAPSFAEGVGKPSDLLLKPLIHYPWRTERRDAPSWERWLIEAEKVEPGVGAIELPTGLRISEELHAIQMSLDGHGVALASSVECARDVAAGRLSMPLEVSIPGLTFYLVHRRGHPRAAELERLALWMREA